MPLLAAAVALGILGLAAAEVSSPAAAGAAAAAPPAGWLGPFEQEYSDKDCANVGSAKNSTPAQCATLCDSPCNRAKGCDAFNYQTSSQSCTFRACSVAKINATARWAKVVSYRRAGAAGPGGHAPFVPPSSWGTVGLAGNSHIHGLLNATAPPLGIDSSGKSDVTAELQAAIVLAHKLGLALFLPLGTYLVSDTLTAYDPQESPFSILHFHFRLASSVAGPAVVPVAAQLVVGTASSAY